MTRNSLVREIQYFCHRLWVTEPGTAYHTRARNCLRVRLKKLLAFDSTGKVAGWTKQQIPDLSSEGLQDYAESLIREQS